MGTIRERITFGFRFTRERFKVVHFESEMGQVRPHHYRAALVELADLDFLIAARRLEKNELGAAAGRVPARFLEPEDVPIKGDRFFQVCYAIPGVEELLDHGTI